MPFSSDLVRNYIAAISVFTVLLGAGYSFVVSEYEYRTAHAEESARFCEQIERNSERLDEMEKKLDGVHLIRAELSGLKSVMSSMDRRLERFENYFLEANK